MSITVSRSVYANGVNSLRVEGVKAATINEKWIIRVACHMAACCGYFWC